MRLSATKLSAIGYSSGFGDSLYNAAGQAPSLDLNFATRKSLTDAVTGASLVTFNRASNGTFVDSAGVLQTAVTNLLLQSEAFNDAAWVKSGATISADQIASPIGLVNADKLVEGTNTGTHNASQTLTVVSGATHVYSVYVKAGERTFAGLYAGNPAQGIVINLSTGAFVNNLISAPTSYSIIPVGNGWYRASIAYTASSTATAPGVYVCNASAAFSYTGDGTSGLFLWGAQLAQSSTVGEYIPTTSTINSAPRFDHNPITGESLGLLVEEQRSNLLLNSGTLSTQSVTVTAAAHTLSFTGTGTITLTGTSTAGPLVGTGTGEANRVSLTFTPTAGSLTLTVSGTVTNAQLEVGSFRTSYIATAGAAATRSADVASITGSAFSGWYSQSEGSWLWDGRFNAVATNFSVFSVFNSAGAGSNRHSIRVGNTIITSGGTQVAEFFQTPVAQTPARYAYGYAVNNYCQVLNSVAVTDLSGALPIDVNTMEIGKVESSQLYSNGTIRRLCYWGQRLPNSTLQTLTQ